MVLTRRTAPSNPPQDPMTIDSNIPVPPTIKGETRLGVGQPAIGELCLDLGDDIELARLKEAVSQQRNLLWLNGGITNLKDVCSKTILLFSEFFVLHGESGLPSIKPREDGRLPSKDGISTVLCTDASWVDSIASFSTVMTNFDDGSWAHLSAHSTAGSVLEVEIGAVHLGLSWAL
uniref:Uncharacterized protein n=1 Tax=Cannabis sativa TaxID=3483 RepID=A0A803QGX4_CANSA